MHLPDPTIDEAALRALVAEQYGTDAAQLQFQPVGGDSWSYRLGDWWVSVRRDRQGHTRQAYEAAHDLRDSGLNFVLAPEVSRNGRVVQWLGPRPVIVSHFIDGRPIFPDDATPEQGRQVDSMVAAIHGAHVEQDLPRETFEQPFAEGLAQSVARALAGAGHTANA